MASILQKNRNNLRTFAYCLLVSFLLLMICSKSSFLYPMNDWSDPHCFFNVGRGMMEGRVTYRDLFEQKGPLLYFLHGLAYLLSPSSFAGVFLLEAAAFTVFLFYCHKIMTLYLRPGVSYALLPLFSLVILTSTSFNKGDSAEELALPLLTIGLYHLLRYFRQPAPSPVSYGVLLANGIFAGCVLWTKYTMLGFWFAWMACLFFSMAARKQLLRAWKSCLVFLGGMALATLPWVLYFGFNHALKDWIDSYIWVNLFSYTKKISVSQRILQWIRIPWTACKQNPVLAVLLASGAAAFLLRKKYLPRLFGRISLILCVFFLDLTVYFRGAGYDYYFLIFAPFAVLGLVAAADAAVWLGRKFRKKAFSMPRWLPSTAAAALCLLCTGGAYFLSPNTAAMGRSADSYAQYQFAGIIRRTPNATLFCYNFLDNGFHFAAGVPATQKYFCGLNLPESEYPDLMESQRRYIREKQTDYVIMREDKMDGVPWLDENYTLIASQTQEYDGSPYTYRLYRAKP